MISLGDDRRVRGRTTEFMEGGNVERGRAGERTIPAAAASARRGRYDAG